MPQEKETFHTGDLVTDTPDIAIEEFCEACHVNVDQVRAFVEEGIVQPHGAERARWRFSYSSVITVRRARRLEHQLGLNPAGAALALELLDQIEDLRRRLARYDTGTE